MTQQRDPLSFDPVPEPVGEVKGAERPATLGEVWDANRILARGDRSDAETLRLRRGYAPILDALDLPESENPANFEDSTVRGAPILHWSRVLGKMATRTDMEAAVARFIRERRKTKPDFLSDVAGDVAGLHDQFIKSERARRDKARETIDRGSGLLTTAVGFGGSVAETMLDPVNVATLPLGGGGKTAMQVAAREALFNGVVEAATQPIVASNRETLGEDYTLGEGLANVATAAVGGAILGGGAKAIELHGKPLAGEAYDRAIAAVHDMLPERARNAWLRQMDVPDDMLADIAGPIIGRDRMTPDERAAEHVIRRDTEIAATSPWTRSHENDRVHYDRMADAMAAILDGVPAADRVGATRRELESGTALGSGTVARAAPDPGGPPIGVDAYMAITRAAESSGSDAARNTMSSAEGRYQFTDGTWLSYYRRHFGNTGESRADILAKKRDGDIQDVLMRDLTNDNADILGRAGFASTSGNLYLAHFAGPKGALALLRADPDTPVSRLLRPEAIAANRAVLEGKSAGEVVLWAHRTMGDRVPRERVAVAPGGEGEAGALRAEADALRADSDRLMAEMGGEVAPPPDAPDIAPVDMPRAAPPPPIDIADPVLSDVPAAVRSDDGPELVRRIIERAGDRRASLRPDKVAAELGISEQAALEALQLAGRTQGSGLIVTRSGKVMRTPGKAPVDIITEIARGGGIRDDEGHLLADQRNWPRKVPFGGDLLSPNGRTIDEWGEKLWDDGWFGPPSAVERPSEAEVLDLLEEGLSSKYYHPDHQAEIELRQRERDSDAAYRNATGLADDAAHQRGLDFEQRDLDEAADLIARGYSPDDAILAVVNARIDEVQSRAAIEADRLDYDPAEAYEGNYGRPDDSQAANDSGRSGGNAGDAGDGGALPKEYLDAQEVDAWRGQGPGDERLLDGFDDPHGAAAKGQAEDALHDLNVLIDRDEAVAGALLDGAELARAAFPDGAEARSNREAFMEGFKAEIGETDGRRLRGTDAEKRGADAAKAMRSMEAIGFAAGPDGETRTLGQIIEQYDEAMRTIDAARACLKPGGGV